MYVSAMLRDERFNGRGHIISKSSGLFVSKELEMLEGGLPVMNAVDVLRLLIIGDVGGVYVALSTRVCQNMLTASIRYVDADYSALQAIDSHIMQNSAFVCEEDEVP